MEAIRIRRKERPDLIFAGTRLGEVCGLDPKPAGPRIAAALYRTAVGAYVLAVEANVPGRPELDLCTAVAFAGAADIGGFLAAEGFWLRGTVGALL